MDAKCRLIYPLKTAISFWLEGKNLVCWYNCGIVGCTVRNYVVHDEVNKPVVSFNDITISGRFPGGSGTGLGKTGSCSVGKAMLK